MGSAYVAQRLGMQEMEPFIFNGFRFLLGALTLVPVIIFRKKNRVQYETDLKRTLAIGSAAGFFLNQLETC